MSQGSEQRVAPESNDSASDNTVSPLLQLVENLSCAADSVEAKSELKTIQSFLHQTWDLPNEWHGQEKSPSLYAATFDLLLQQMLGIPEKYPELQNQVEELLLSWNYCVIQSEDGYFNLSTVPYSNKPSATPADGISPAQWHGFARLGFKRPGFEEITESGETLDPIPRYIPEALSTTAQTSLLKETRFWQLFATQCFPHPDDGSFFYQRKAFGPTRLKNPQQGETEVYPFEWQHACDTPAAIQADESEELPEELLSAQAPETSETEEPGEDADLLGPEDVLSPGNEPDVNAALAEDTEAGDAFDYPEAKFVEHGFFDKPDHEMRAAGKAKRLTPENTPWLSRLTSEAKERAAEKLARQEAEIVLQKIAMREASEKTRQFEKQRRLNAIKDARVRISRLRYRHLATQDKPDYQEIIEQEKQLKTHLANKRVQQLRAQRVRLSRTYRDQIQKIELYKAARELESRADNDEVRLISFFLHETEDGNPLFKVSDSFFDRPPMALPTSYPLSPAELRLARSKRLQEARVRRVQASRKIKLIAEGKLANTDVSQYPRVVAEGNKRLHPVKATRVRLSRQYLENPLFSPHVIIDSSPLLAKDQANQQALTEFLKIVRNTPGFENIDIQAALSETRILTLSANMPAGIAELKTQLSPDALNQEMLAAFLRILQQTPGLASTDLQQLLHNSPVLALKLLDSAGYPKNLKLKENRKGRQQMTRATMWHVIVSRVIFNNKNNPSWRGSNSYLLSSTLSPAGRMAKTRHALRIWGERAFDLLVTDNSSDGSNRSKPQSGSGGQRGRTRVVSLSPVPAPAAAVPSDEAASNNAGKALYLTTPATTAAGVSPVADVPPHTPSPENKDKFHGFSGSLAVHNTQLEFTLRPNYSLTSTVAYKPIKDSYYFIRSGMTVKPDGEFSYNWGMGYDDWHPGTWGLQVNNWNPLKPGDGLDLDNAVVSLSHKFKADLLKSNNLSSSLSLSKSKNSEASLTFFLSWSPRESWFVRTLLTQSLESDELSWSYGFGYNDWRKNTLALEYNNWGFNKAFDTNFRSNAIISLSYKWEW